MPYNFETFKRSHGGGYHGASVKNTGLYMTKSLMEDIPLSPGDRVLFQVDRNNNAFRLKRDENGWKITKSSEHSSGASLGSGGEGDFFREVDLEYGRYELVEDDGNNFVFEYNPDL